MVYVAVNQMAVFSFSQARLMLYQRSNAVKSIIDNVDVFAHNVLTISCDCVTKKQRRVIYGADNFKRSNGCRCEKAT